jgi:hypothetical protein
VYKWINRFQAFGFFLVYRSLKKKSRQAVEICTVSWFVQLTPTPNLKTTVFFKNHTFLSKFNFKLNETDIVH